MFQLLIHFAHHVASKKLRRN
uniref:Uncharacterized protein n=1 Tax=Arundo donax TaxID=35708 RepID=A0A0A9DMH9_ARUDO